MECDGRSCRRIFQRMTVATLRRIKCEGRRRDEHGTS
jgi:hypothetical protein